MTSAMKDCPYRAETSERKAWAEGHGHAVAKQDARREEEVAGPAYAAGFVDGIEAALTNIEDLILDPNDPLRAYLDRDLVVAALGYAAQAVARLRDERPMLEQMLGCVTDAETKAYELNTKSRRHEIDAVRDRLSDARREFAQLVSDHPGPNAPPTYFVRNHNPADGVQHVAELFELNGGTFWADRGDRIDERRAAGEELARRLGEAQRARNQRK